MKDLTDKQQEILDFIVHCIKDEYYTPTVRELADRFGIKSTNGVRNHLDALERKGYLTRKSGSSRGIELTEELLTEAPAGIPLVGRVAAGLPITASENLEGYVTMDNLFAQPDRLYALRVSGDSMIDAGIWNGDYVIVREQANVENGEIGVAIVEEEATVKYIYRRGNIMELVPANDNFSPIIVDLEEQDFRIGGKVVGVHRVIK